MQTIGYIVFGQVNELAQRVKDFTEAGQVMRELESYGFHPKFYNPCNFAKLPELPLLMDHEEEPCIITSHIHNPVDIVI